MKHLLLILAMFLSFSLQAQNQDAPFRTFEKIKTNPVSATEYLQRLLDDPSVSQIPYGYYYVPDSIISWQNKYYNWNGSVIYSDKDNSPFLLRGSQFTIENLTIDKTMCKVCTPDNHMITIQNKRANMSYYVLRNIRLRGNQRDVFSRENAGNNGIFYDGDTETPGPYKGNRYGENHWGIIEITEFWGLNTALIMSKERNDSKMPNSRHKIFMQGSRVKSIAEINGVNGVNLEVKFNGAHLLLDSEKDRELITLKSNRNTVRMEVVDFARKSKYFDQLGLTKHYHKYAIHNYGRQNVLLEGSTVGLPIKEMIINTLGKVKYRMKRE